MTMLRTTVVLTALSLFGGCASSVVPSSLECADATPRKITIVYQRHNKIKVAPPRREVDRGEVLQYKVKGPEARAFEVNGTKGPGSASPAWLDAEGRGSPDGNSYFVCVKEDQAVGDYEYEVTIDGVGMLDPVVHVN